MKKIYIFILELIVSICSIVLKRNGIDEKDSNNVSIEDETLSRSNRNTFSKLFALRKKLQQNNKIF